MASAKYRAANKEKVNAAQAAYRAANPTRARKWEKDNQDAVLTIKRNWRKTHPGAVRAINAARRTLAKRQRCTCCTSAEIRHVYEIAALCGAEVDHIVPLAVGGPHCAKNLQALSPEEHCAKTRLDQVTITKHRRRAAG